MMELNDLSAIMIAMCFWKKLIWTLAALKHLELNEFIFISKIFV